MRFSDSANRLSGQPMFKLLDRVAELEKQGKKFIHFEIGDPSFESPEIVNKYGIKAIESGKTHYTSSSGIIELRQAIAKFYGQHFSCNLSSDNIIIAPGCNPLIYSLIECLVNKDENVIITDPCFPTYPSVLDFMGIETKRINLKENKSFSLDLNDIKDCIDSKTKMIIINSPNNPTGSVMDPNEIESIIKFASKFNITVICDEIYNLLNYTPISFSAAELFGNYSNFVVISGFSKAFAMSGWRIGYMIAHPDVCEKISLFLQTTVSCTNTISQYASMGVFESIQEIEKMKKQYLTRRNILVDRLNRTRKISCSLPMGAFYAFANVSKSGMNGEQFCDYMLNHEVALLPGVSFGPSSTDYVRLCFTRPTSEIEEGIDRIERAL